MEKFNGKKYFLKSSKMIYDIYSIEDRKIKKCEISITKNYKKYLYQLKIENLKKDLSILKNKIEKTHNKYDISEYIYKSKLYYKIINQGA